MKVMLSILAGFRGMQRLASLINDASSEQVGVAFDARSRVEPGAAIQLLLNRIPCGPVDDWLVLTPVCVSAVLHASDINRIAQQPVKRTTPQGLAAGSST